MIEVIRSNAELIRSLAKRRLGLDLEYDHEAVKWLDGFLTRQRESLDPDQRHGLVQAAGSFLGECIIKTYGGEWSERPDGWCVQLDAGAHCFPFSKAEKQLMNGPTDSVLSLFEVLPIMIKKLQES